MTFDEQIAARTIWAEARGEPEDGQRAVAHCIANRLRDGSFGKNLASVCLAPFQFSCWNANDSNRKQMALLRDDDPALLHFAQLIENAMLGTDTDPTQGAICYARYDANPPWATKSYVQIGNHRFYREVK